MKLSIKNNNSKSIFIFRLIIIYFILMFSFFLFMIIGCLIPSKWLEKNVKESSNIFNKQGPEYQLLEEYPMSYIDNYTDIIMVNESYSVDNSDPIYSSLAVRRNYNKGVTKHQYTNSAFEHHDLYLPDKELEYIIDNKIDRSNTYSRYWHCYIPILRK